MGLTRLLTLKPLIRGSIMSSELLFKTLSAFNDKPIYATLTTTSSNTKTGDIPQINILVSEEKPTDAIKTGCDTAICGNCPLKPSIYYSTPIELRPLFKPCYVNKGFGPNAIHRSKEKGTLKPASETFYSVIRHGSYGDPGALSEKENDLIRSKAKKILAYTHSWAKKGASYLSQFCMASVHTIKDKIKANKLGYRTYRTVPFAASKLETDEIVCPNFTRSVQCKDCGLCDGNQSSSGKNIVIPAH